MLPRPRFRFVVIVLLELTWVPFAWLIVPPFFHRAIQPPLDIAYALLSLTGMVIQLWLCFTQRLRSDRPLFRTVVDSLIAYTLIILCGLSISTLCLR